MITIADKIIDFNKSLEFKGRLPEGISIMNPFKENETILPISSLFYKKYYNDLNKRHLILGINPGRFGSGLTGIPFTDPKRLIANCGIEFEGNQTHELSSVFVYDVIKAFGGEFDFYSKFYISSVCPLGFTSIGKAGKPINYNYYDSRELTNAVFQFVIENIEKQISMGIYTDVCYCFGAGKNEKFLREINNRYHFFDKIIGLDHPRFVMQYKSKSKEMYISKYLDAFSQVQNKLD